MANHDVSAVRAAVYLRISQDATGEAAGVTRQREDCLDLVERQGWALHEVYTDNDISATKGKARPGYRKMLAAIAAGDVDAVVAWHPDRLYRKLTDLEGLIEAIESRNVVMRTVRAGEIDLSTPTGRMLARILSATAQAEGEIKADRWKRSWRQGREAGNPARTGSRLFGYTRDSEVIDAEAEIARHMFAHIATGGSIMALSKRLQADGVLTTRGTTWRTAAIRNYLLNPRVTAYSTLKGEIVAEGDWEPIIDRDTWETVRALLSARQRQHPVRVALLNGLIFCGKCETRLVTGKSRGKRLYQCPSHRPGFDGCGGVSVYADRVEEIVESFTRARLEDPRVVQRVAELTASDSASLIAEITGLESRVIELEEQLDRPGVPVERIIRAIDRARERIAACQEELVEAADSLTPVNVGGMEWPADLAMRRRLVEIGLRGLIIYLDPVTPPVNVFNPKRVRITPRPSLQ